ncbi:MAG: hypothetical protein H0W84_06960, partial [Bacteroidetes bacterium]|nr:hypothetical protein [Bacteroidota bacterium]
MKKYFIHTFALIILMSFCLKTLSIKAQQLNYKTREVGNTWYGMAGAHMQNHVNDIEVAGDGTVKCKSVWDEGGHPCANYKDGKFVSKATCDANSKQENDSKGRSWTIEKYYGRFLNGPDNHGGKDATGTWKINAVPVGSSAPYVKCANGWTINDAVDPSAIGINLKTGELLVADNGHDQFIRVYDINGTAPILKGTFGVKGGVYAGSSPGVMDDPKKFCGITGVGGDNNGYIYVVCDGYPGSEGEGGGACIRAFNPDGTLRWSFESSAFVQSASIEPSTDGIHIQGPFHKWTIDYSKPTGSDETTSTININPFKYPDDPRLVHATNICFAVRWINGKKYIWTTDMYNNMVFTFRMDGEIAVPCAAFTTAWGWNDDEYIYNYWKYKQGRPAIPNGSRTRYLWADRNGDGLATSNEFETFNVGQFLDGGMEVDQFGNLLLGYSNKVYKFPANGFDSFGNPKYSVASLTMVVDLGTAVKSLAYLPDQDMMVVGVNNFATANIYQHFFNGPRSLLRSISLPSAQNNNCNGAGICQVTADKDYIYSTFKCQNGHYTGKEGEVDVHRISDGSFVGYITPGPEVQSRSGWIDVNMPTHVFARANGERNICVEEDWVGRVLVYQ